MKKIFTLFVLLTQIYLGYAKPVSLETAKIVAKNYLVYRTNAMFKSDIALDLSYSFSSNVTNANAATKPVDYIYVFNATNYNGYIMVSADDRVIPVLGYSNESKFDSKNIPINAAKWFEGYKTEIRFAIENDINATEEITKQWQGLLTNPQNNISFRGTNSVNPLIQTKWDQSPYYNALCPYDNSASERTVTGCVATAMAQVMKFWNYPTNGSGFHSYKHSKYGTLSANFGTTTYDWSSMPNNVTSANTAVATLMYHCGVSVDMDYGLGSNSGSSAQTLDVESALKTYFGYSSSVKGVYRTSYSSSQWITLLKSELDAGRPMQYAGTGNGGGHSFVCDGYRSSDDFFHFNWGWSGSDDGYFSINALNPASLGTGGGSGGFNSNHRAIIGIEPPSGTQTYNMGLYGYITPSATSIYYGNSFTVSADIANNGSNTYSGDFCAAIFDDAYNFVDYIEIKTNKSLQSNYWNTYVFSTSHIYGMLPGNYYVGIFYRPTGGNWVVVANSGAYKNFVSMQVINPNNIELYSSMKVTPAVTLTQGQSASVNLNILNDGTTNFTGQYQVGLYDLNDGALVQTIETRNATQPLPPGSSYQSPYWTFTTSSITADPGTYLIALLHKSTGNNNWELTGSTYYQNPIKINVKAPDIQPDPYEVNNTKAQSYILPITFSGNTASKNTNGSNCHVGSDYDYYKIVIPSGYNYVITARIHDSQNSGNSQTYTLDGLVSYSIGSSAWSDAYDDIISPNIKVNDGGTVYFQVSPYFAGQTGTYLLDMNITRTPTANISNIIVTELIKIYPNPTNEITNVDLSEFDGKVQQIQVVDLQGKVLNTLISYQNNNIYQFNLSAIADGIYMLQVTTDKGIINKKITVTK